MTFRRAGFTLIELMAVLVLSGLLAAAVSMSFAASKRVVSLADAVQRVVQADRRTRELARQFNRPMQLLLQLDRGQIVPVDAETQKPHGAAVELEGGFTIEQVLLADQHMLSGELALPCSAAGYTPSYAIQVVSPQGDSQWILIAGLTGQLCRADNEREVTDIFKALRRADAD